MGPHALTIIETIKQRFAKNLLYLKGAYIGSAALVSAPLLYAVFARTGTPTELTFATTACLGSHALLLHFYEKLKAKLHSTTIMTCMQEIVVSTAVVELIAGLIQIMGSYRSSSATTPITPVYTAEFIYPSEGYVEQVHLITEAFESTQIEDLEVQGTAEDGVTHEELADGTVVYILDDCTTSYISEATLRTLMSRPSTLKNPFTNLPIRQIRKRTLKLIPATTDSPNGN